MASIMYFRFSSPSLVNAVAIAQSSSEKASSLIGTRYADRTTTGARARHLRRIRASRRAGVSTRQNVLHSARSEEHTSELQSLMRISYAVFCLKKKKENNS